VVDPEALVPVAQTQEDRRSQENRRLVEGRSLEVAGTLEERSQPDRRSPLRSAVALPGDLKVQVGVERAWEGVLVVAEVGVGNLGRMAAQRD
jgi:hypothetical protein